MILQCVRWYVAYSLSYRDLEELMQERGYAVDHSTIERWVVYFASRMLKKGQNRSSLPAWEQFYALALTR
ncbi:MAG: transposase-like protein [Halioglobus sp.]|jgi:transposase-like protein